jgi:hypothetical protein
MGKFTNHYANTNILALGLTREDLRFEMTENI